MLLGLLLLAVTAAFAGLLIADNLSGGPDYGVSVIGHHIATLNSLGIFLAGLALALLFSLGCAVLVGSVRRRRRMASAVPMAPMPAERVATKPRDTADSVGEAPVAPAARPVTRHRFHFGH